MKIKIKKTIIKEYANIIQRYKIIFIIKNNGSKVSDIINLRKSLEKKKCKIVMIKKSLMKIAIRDTKFNNIKNKLEGPSIFIFSNLMLETSRIIKKLMDKKSCFIPIGGAYEKESFNKNTIFDIGKLKNDNELKIKTLYLIKILIYNIIKTIMVPVSNILNLLKKRK